MGAADPVLARLGEKAATLRLAPAPDAAPPTIGETAFAAALALLLGVGVVLVLLLNTATQTQADRIAIVKQRLSALVLAQQTAQVAIDRAAAPAAIAAQARDLGLRPASRLPVLHAVKRPSFPAPQPHRAKRAARTRQAASVPGSVLPPHTTTATRSRRSGR